MATPFGDSYISTLSSTTNSQVMDDGRGLTTGGVGFSPPNFESTSPHRPSKRSSRGGRPFPMVPLPLAAVSPEELELEDTLVEGQAFTSSGNSQVGGSGHHSGSNSIITGNSTSYSRAVMRGRLDTSNLVSRSCFTTPAHSAGFWGGHSIVFFPPKATMVTTHLQLTYYSIVDCTATLAISSGENPVQGSVF
jgi:hypothetical protein